MYLIYLLFSGEPLSQLEEKATRFQEIAVARKQEAGLSFLRPALAMIHSLVGKTEEGGGNIIISTEANNVGSYRATNIQDKSHMADIFKHFLICLSAYILQDYETAAAEAEKMEISRYIHRYAHPGIANLFAYNALASLAALVDNSTMYHGLPPRRMLKRVKRIIKMLHDFCLYNPENCLGQACLVEAEFAALNGRNQVARGKYVLAISVALENNDLMLRAVSCERMSMFLRRIGDVDGSTRSLREAYTAYDKWGATIKTQQLEKKYPDLFARENGGGVVG